MLGSHVRFYLTLWMVLLGLVHHCNGQGDQECDDYIDYNSFRRFGDSCFYISKPNDPRTWYEAQKVCADWKGNLATVVSNETVGFLHNNIRFANQGFWIGLYINATDLVSDIDEERRRQANWKWVDGTPYDYRDLPGWQNHEPWYGDQLGLLRGLKWEATTSPLERHLYICETKLPQNTATQKPQEESDTDDERSIKKCGGDWTYSNAGHKCFKLVDTGNDLTWPAANSYCQEQLSGLLACPSTEKYHDDVVSVIRKAGKSTSNVWIGLQNPGGVKGPLSDISGRRSGWTWIDNSNYQYQKWSASPGEPQSGEKYVRIYEGEWKGIQDDGIYSHFLCQKAPTPDVTPAPTALPPNPATNDNPNQSGSDGGTKKNPATADPQQVKRNGGEDGNKNKGILGPIIGVIAAAVLVVVVVAVFIMKHRGSGNFRSFMDLLPFKKKENEYAEAIDHTYHNDEVNPTTSVSQQNVAVVSDNSPKLKSQNRFVQKDNPVTTPEPHVRNPLHIYATVKKPFKPAIPAKAAAKPIKDKPYATLNLKKLLMPKPKLEKASSLEQLNMRSEPNGAYENTVFSSAVRVEELNDWVKQATASHAIEEQYKSVQQSAPNEQKIYCNKVEFKPKNRYKNLVPYDSNRVELSQLNGDPYSHYINASYVDSYYQKKAFIAAQGPTSNTVNDFWRMIWEKSVKVIVTVSNQTEPDTGKLNFVQYWPKGKEIESFGDLSVTLKKVENLPDYIVRHMAVSKRADIQIVKQYLFKSWRDHNVPKHAMALINYHEKIRKEISKGKDPVLVHCSAGVGRTGTYIAIDYLLEQAKKEGVVDFLLCLKKLRQQRTDMVQKLIQYQFLIRAVLEALTLGKTAITCSDFAKSVQLFRDPLSDGVTRMQKQFEMLAHYFTEEQRSHDAAKLPENISKNRDKNVLPISSKRVLLMTPVSEKNDYINAVFVDGHRRKSAYIATHAPLEHTVVDFWRAVFDYNSNVIVMLCPKYYMKTDEAYFPEGLGDKTDVAPFEIECIEEDDHNGVRRKQLSLKYCGLERYICHFSITEDLSAMSTQEKMTTLYYIYENAKKWQQQQPEKKAPVTVHCLEGTEWTGLYCTLSNLFDQMNEEQEVDVFHAAGQLRLARTQFIPTMKQYEMIYDILSLYIDQFNMYSNFQ